MFVVRRPSDGVIPEIRCRESTLFVIPEIRCRESIIINKLNFVPIKTNNFGYTFKF